MRRLYHLAVLTALLTSLSGCELFGDDLVAGQAARKEAEGKAVGGACRHAGRAIEDCFAMNKRVDKAALFAGWREMNDYMRENKIEAVAPQGLPAGESSAKAEANDTAKGADEAGSTEPTLKKPGKNKRQAS